MDIQPFIALAVIFLVAAVIYGQFFHVPNQGSYYRNIDIISLDAAKSIILSVLILGYFTVLAHLF